MRFAGAFLLISALAQLPASPPHAEVVVAPEPRAGWAGGVSRCPDGFYPETHNLRLVEVPDSQPQLVDQTGGRPGNAPPVPEVCVMPAR